MCLMLAWHHFMNDTVISSCCSLIWPLFFTCVNRNISHGKNTSAACCPFRTHRLYYWKYPDFWPWISRVLRFEDPFSCPLKSSEDCLTLKIKMKKKKTILRNVGKYLQIYTSQHTWFFNSICLWFWSLRNHIWRILKTKWNMQIESDFPWNWVCVLQNHSNLFCCITFLVSGF